MARPVHFEIQADDPARAIDFYETVLGWRFRQFDSFEYWLIETGTGDKPGIEGGLLRRKGPAPEAGVSIPVIAYVCAMEVTDLDTYENAVRNAGGEIVVERHAIPGVGWRAYAKDTEGNVFALSQPDPSAG